MSLPDAPEVEDPAIPAGPPPLVSVVLPVRNEGAHLGAVLADLLGQVLPEGSFEVLVVDGMSTDDTVAVAQAAAEHDPRVRVLTNPGRLSSAARAIGSREARGEYVAFVDGHCRIPSPRLLADMVDLFRRTGAACLARPQPLDAAPKAPLARAIAAARASRFGHSLRSTIWEERERPVSPVSAGAMYRREVFERVGTFDPAFDACEDVEFNWRAEQAGMECWTSPRLAVRYVPRASLGSLFRQMRRYGLGRARLHRKHPKAFTIESLVPAAFVLGLVPLALTPWMPAVGALLVGTPYLLYLLLLVAASFAASARAGWSLLPLLPLCFLTIHAGLGVGYLAGRLLPWPRVPVAPARG
jgi:GT2 family glycosyltransferase